MIFSKKWLLDNGSYYFTAFTPKVLSNGALWGSSALKMAYLTHLRPQDYRLRA